MLNSQVRTSEYFDTTTHAGGFDEWFENNYRQLGRNSYFHGRIIDRIFNNDLRITHETIDTAFVEQVGRVTSNKVLMINISSESDVLLNGHMVNSDQFHISSGKAIHAIARHPIKAFVVTIDKKLFIDAFGFSNHELASHRPYEIFLKPIEAVDTFAQKKFKAFLNEEDETLKPESLISFLGGILEQRLDKTQHPIAPSTRTYIVDKSCEYLFEHLDEDLGVLEICNHLRISRRTLQYSFESTIGISPSAYIRYVRLNVAKKLIQLAPDDKIQNAAIDAGFTHLGRFSKYYQDFFGELPSSTKLQVFKQ